MSSPVHPSHAETYHAQVFHFPHLRTYFFLFELIIYFSVKLFVNITKSQFLSPNMTLKHRTSVLQRLWDLPILLKKGKLQNSCLSLWTMNQKTQSFWFVLIKAWKRWFCFSICGVLFCLICFVLFCLFVFVWFVYVCCCFKIVFLCEYVMTPGGCFPCYQKVGTSFYFLPCFKLSRFSSRAYSQLYSTSTWSNDLEIPSTSTSWRISTTSITLMLCYEIAFHHLKRKYLKFRSFFFINFPEEKIYPKYFAKYWFMCPTWDTQQWP